MPKTYYRGEQRFRNPGMIAILVLFTLLLTYHLLFVLPYRTSLFNLGISGVIGSLLAVGWWGVYRSRLRIKVCKKYVKIRTKGLIGRRIKLRSRNIEQCTFVDLSPSARWSGCLVQPTSNFTNFDFGGRRGVCIRMRNGQSYFIGSDELYARRQQLPFPIPAPAN